jgi:hypothetical protein
MPTPKILEGTSQFQQRFEENRARFERLRFARAAGLDYGQ